ncbi:hypothetical protein VTN96DRAFT_4334 [Rasamsonia emersonii]
MKARTGRSKAAPLSGKRQQKTSDQKPQRRSARLQEKLQNSGTTKLWPRRRRSSYHHSRQREDNSKGALQEARLTSSPATILTSKPIRFPSGLIITVGRKNTSRPTTGPSDISRRRTTA